MKIFIVIFSGMVRLVKVWYVQVMHVWQIGICWNADIYLFNGVQIISTCTDKRELPL